MHLLKAISHGCGTNGKDILQFEQAAPALYPCLLSTNNAVALPPWYVCWLVMIPRPRFYRHAFQLKIGSFNKLIIAQNHYPFQAFVLVRFCCLVMTTATFAPPLNEVKPSLSNAVFSVRSLLLWPTLELEIPPSNEGIYHCIRVKKRESDLNMYTENVTTQ